VVEVGSCRAGPKKPSDPALLEYLQQRDTRRELHHLTAVTVASSALWMDDNPAARFLALGGCPHAVDLIDRVVDNLAVSGTHRLK
jgi:hypothetical protein